MAIEFINAIIANSIELEEIKMMGEFFNHFHFIRPLALLALPLVLLIIWRLLKSDNRNDSWSKICDPHLLDAIKVSNGSKGSRWMYLLWPISIMAILAIAGPAFRKLPTPVIKNQSALILALDVSKSMLADDVKPNRLERAKFKINDILDQRKDGQTALIVYAGDAFVVTPLTDDTETIALMLKAISPDIMPVQGSRVDIALKKSESLLKQAGYRNGDIIVLTDGVNLSQAQAKAEQLSADNITTSILAIGTAQGAPIPSQSGFVKDKAGNIVIPKLEISALRELAQSGKGRFSQMTGDNSDITIIMPTTVDDDNESDSEQNDAFDTAQFIDEGPWLTLLILPLMVLLFRKGLLLCTVFVVGLHSPNDSYAFEWRDLWLNDDQKAAKHIDAGEIQEAYDTAQSEQWKATAAYKKKDYQNAQELFNDGSADGFYNQGNALAHSGQLEKALEAYEQSLQLRPDDEDTLYNKKQVEEALQKQEQEQQNEQQNQDDQENDQQQEQQQDQQDQENEQDQQNQDSESQDSQDQQGEQDQQEGDNPEQQQEQKEQSSEMTEEQKKQQEQEQKQLEEADKKEQEAQKEQQEQKEMQLTPEELAEDAENKEAIEQWLRRIPDDPGGLLRRKFYYQYNQQNKKPDEQENW